MDSLWFTFLIVIGVRLIAAACGDCSSRNVQCLTSTSYKLCNRGTPVDVTYVCGPNQFCISENIGTCSANGPPDCTCGTCIGGFACTSGSTIPNTAALSCPANTFCDTTSTLPNYCSSIKGNSGCSISDACSMRGRNPLSGTSCTKYVFCEINTSGNWTRTEFTCPQTSLFDPDRRKCSSDYKCPA